MGLEFSIASILTILMKILYLMISYIRTPTPITMQMVFTFSIHKKFLKNSFSITSKLPIENYHLKMR